MTEAGDTLASGDLAALLRQARELSWRVHGKKLVCYVPGMFTYFKQRGKYPGISITGEECALGCEHCKGQLLKPMIGATAPERLVEVCQELDRKGNEGCLLSGGCREDGTMPWLDYTEAIAKIKRTTVLKISVHTGIIDYETAKALKDAGADQALFDVTWSDEILKNVYHLDMTTADIRAAMDAIHRAGLDFVPHVIVGLNYGRLDKETEALEAIARYAPSTVVIVAFMPLDGTGMEDVRPASPEDIARILAIARLKLPDSELSLGCARPRRTQDRIDVYAVEAGINRIAIPTEEALDRARELGLEVEFKNTCCSVD